MLLHFPKLWRSLRERLVLAQYDHFSIADHFRGLGAHVGSDCRIYIRDLGSEPWLVRIGNHVTIAAGASLITHDGGSWVFTEELPALQSFGPVEIRDNCFIGAGSILLPGVHVGPNSVVGAGAVVTRDVPPDTVVAGSPARAICSLQEYRIRLLESWRQQCPDGYMAELRDAANCPPRLIEAAKRRDSAMLREHLQQLFFSP